MAQSPKPRSARGGASARRASPPREARAAGRTADAGKAAQKPDGKTKASPRASAQTASGTTKTVAKKTVPKKAAPKKAAAVARGGDAALPPSVKAAPPIDSKAKSTKPARTTKAAAGRTTTKNPASRAKTKRANTGRTPKTEAPPFLAVELGTPVDPQGEPIGAGSPRAQSDRELQEYALQLWRQMQRGSVTKRYLRSIERAGFTLGEVWTVGLREIWTTSSTADEMRRYRQKMLFRANLLEAILSETVADLHRLEGIEPSDAPPAVATDAKPKSQSARGS